MASAPASPPPGELLGQMIFGKCLSMAISVAATLRIADKLAAGPKTSAELAAETETHAPSLYRVLRALAGVGVFSESAEGTFSLTPTVSGADLPTWTGTFATCASKYVPSSFR